MSKENKNEDEEKHRPLFAKIKSCAYFFEIVLPVIQTFDIIYQWFANNS